MGGHEQGLALAGQGAEQVGEHLLGGHVQAGEGLVQKEELRTQGQGAGHQDPLALAAGELAHGPGGQVVHAGADQGLLDGALVLQAGAAQPPQ